MPFDPLLDFNLINTQPRTRAGNGLFILPVEEVLEKNPWRVRLRDRARNLAIDVFMATSDVVKVDDKVILVDLPNGVRVGVAQGAAALPADFTTRTACRKVKVLA